MEYRQTVLESAYNFIIPHQHSVVQMIVENFNYVKTNVSENIKRCFTFRKFNVIKLHKNITLK